ncbi:aminomethyl transferase family protein [Streptomyces sp. NPDC002143]
MNPSPFSQSLPTPLYPEVTVYSVLMGQPRAFEFNGWKPETMSWKTGCYIHSGLSGPSQTTFEGPNAEKFLSSLCINGFSGFKSGTAKHAIMLTDNGLVAAHGLLQRDNAERFRLFAGGIWPLYQLAKSGQDVQTTSQDIYIFQISGPTALQTLERATGESLRDVGFLHFRNTQVDGIETEICRIGMSGTLSYELRGPFDEGPRVYDAVVRAGKDFGLERLGWRAYPVNHVEGGFAQAAWTFAPALMDDAGFGEFMAKFAGQDIHVTDVSVSGSVDPADARARYRTPVELGWHRAARFDHDFIGRASLEKEVAEPKRTIVTLRWNPEDVIDIYASLLRPGEEYKTIDLPTSPPFTAFLSHADQVLKDGEPVGIASGTVYSYYYREVISHCTIDLEHAEIGTEVIVQWGDHGEKIKDVRATVARFPYLEAPRNENYDVSTIPSGVST